VGLASIGSCDGGGPPCPQGPRRAAEPERQLFASWTTARSSRSTPSATAWRSTAPRCT